MAMTNSRQPLSYTVPAAFPISNNPYQALHQRYPPAARKPRNCCGRDVCDVPLWCAADCKGVSKFKICSRLVGGSRSFRVQERNGSSKPIRLEPWSVYCSLGLQDCHLCRGDLPLFNFGGHFPRLDLPLAMTVVWSRCSNSAEGYRALSSTLPTQANVALRSCICKGGDLPNFQDVHSIC